MFRCDLSAGFYRITFSVLHSTEDHHQQIVGHLDLFSGVTPEGRPRWVDGSPVLKTEEPWEGELCEHELQWLNGVPGKDYPAHYDFKVEKVKAPSKK